MVMKLLRLREIEDDIVAIVHLDTSKVDSNNEPDQEYIVKHVFPKDSGGLTRNKYIQDIKKELRDRCRRQLSALNDAKKHLDQGTNINGEGEEL